MIKVNETPDPERTFTKEAVLDAFRAGFLACMHGQPLDKCIEAQERILDNPDEGLNALHLTDFKTFMRNKPSDLRGDND